MRGLETRLQATGIEKIVIGVSGGLDSTHALIVAAQAVDRLGLPRENVLAYTMPGFATSERTLANAHRLMRALGVSASRARHPARGDADAPRPRPPGRRRGAGLRHHLRERAGRRAHLAPVPARQPPRRARRSGPATCRELALGWATYGVGDQMSHYHVNASVPKTLIQFLLRWAIDTDQFGADVDEVLDSVLNTEISPELVPRHDR